MFGTGLRNVGESRAKGRVGVRRRRPLRRLGSCRLLKGREGRGLQVRPPKGWRTTGRRALRRRSRTFRKREWNLRLTFCCPRREAQCSVLREGMSQDMVDEGVEGVGRGRARLETRAHGPIASCPSAHRNTTHFLVLLASVPCARLGRASPGQVRKKKGSHQRMCPLMSSSGSCAPASPIKRPPAPPPAL